MVRGRMETTFLRKRFVIVAGKGGVGKSTMCAALALAAARAGKRTIVAELNTRERVPQLFGAEPSGYVPTQVRENLFSINIQPEPALHEYGLRKVRLERVYRAVFENEAMKRLLKMIPGMNELLLLGKAFDLERERDRSGRPVWDMVIVDAPATGHGVSLLRLPQAILDVIRSGPMAEEVRAMRRLLVDPERTMLNIVTLPEEMPVRETFELLDQVDTVLEMPTGWLLVNGVWPTPPDADELALAAAIGDAAPDDAVVQGALSCLDVQVRRRGFQQAYLDELHERITLPIIELPFLFGPDFGAEAIGTLSDRIISEATRLALIPPALIPPASIPPAPQGPPGDAPT